MGLSRLAYNTRFSRLVCRTKPATTGIRMASTIVGNSGRVYTQGKVLRPSRDDHTPDIFKAESGTESFVFKRVSKPFYNLSLRLAAEFAGSRRLRMHTDCNPEQSILVYPYFRDTLLALIREDPELPFAERRKILRHVAEALSELHSRDWIHIDVKPDNILVNWTCDANGNKTISDATLSDFDIAFKSEGGAARQTPYAIGNAMWRSPEGQTGRGVTKASDVFSFGLVCVYALGGGDLLLLDDYQELAQRGISPEQEIVTRQFCYFGPPTEGLFKQIDDEGWCDDLKKAATVAERALKEQPELRFEHWGEGLGPAAQDMISGMTNPDPTARLTIDQVLAHPWWQEEDS